VTSAETEVLMAKTRTNKMTHPKKTATVAAKESE